MTGKDLEQATELYQKNCVACHGQGLYATTLAPPATNFRQVRPSQAFAEAALANGLPRTAMPPWKALPSEEKQADDKRRFLSDDERRLLARYVRSLYLPQPPAE